MKLSNTVSSWGSWLTGDGWRWLLVGIVVSMAALRIVGLTHTPPAPYWEEAALGYDAYSILQTGRDHHGHSFPVVAFESFGDYKPSLYFYSLVPSIAIFGLDTFAVRLPAALFSVFSGVVIMVWSYQLTKNRHVPILVGLLYAIQPWSWLIGRVGFEVNLATLLIIAGAFALWRSFQVPSRSSFGWLAAAVTALALSMYAYHGARLLAPLFALVVFMSQVPWKQEWHQRTFWLKWIAAAILAMVLIAPILGVLRSPTVQQRFNETSVWSDITPIITSNTLRAQADNSLLSRLFYHRWVLRGSQIAQNYLDHFSVAFLFTDGDANPRHASQYTGMLYPWELLTVLLGIIAAAVWLRVRDQYMLLGLVAVTPIAAALTLATPHALRALPLAPLLALVSGLGATWFVTQFPAQLASRRLPEPLLRAGGWIFTSLVLAVSGCAFGAYLWNQYPARTAQEWQTGYREVITALRYHQQPNESLFLSRELGRPAMYVWFVERTDPQRVQAAANQVPRDQGEFLQWEEWTFFDGQVRSDGLHAAPPHLVPTGADVIEEVRDRFDQVRWVVYR